MSEALRLIISVTFILAPVVAISFLMTTKNKKLKVVGYYLLSGLTALFGLGFFWLAYTGENRGGYAWIGLCALGSFWAYQKANSIKGEKK